MLHYIWNYLGTKKIWSDITSISSKDICFILKSMNRIERHIKVGVCVKKSTSNEFEVEYYVVLEEVIELQYYSEHNIVFFNWNDIGMIPQTKESR